MNKYVWMFLILILIVSFVLLLEKLRKKTLEKLDQILYIEQNPSLYLELLGNKHFHWILRKESIAQLKLNGYLMLNDHKKIEEYFDLLENAYLTKGEKLDYNTKKLSYYALHHNQEKAEKAKSEIEKMLKNNTKKQDILEESELIYKIYIEHDYGQIKTLKEKLKHQNGLTKGISYFRCAKLYHDHSKDDKAKECLKLAEPFVKNTIYDSIIKECNLDLNKLKEY